MPAVSIEAVGAAGRGLIERLAQFYVYDFSELHADSPTFELDETGAFPAIPELDAYWDAAGAFALLIRADGRPAGFALVNTRSHRGGRVERNMGEFFVVRKHRRRGVATQAVRQVLARLPGRWEVAVAERNLAAQAFWPRAIAAAAVSELARHEGDGALWRGPIWSFLARD
jgi:predicted acetyltransferase